MRSPLVFGTAALATAATAAPNYIFYFDQWHTANLPDKSQTAGVTHVITAFANSSLFAAEPAGKYEPFMPLDDIRALFDDGTKICMAIGGWADTAGFSAGAKSDKTRKSFARNVANTLARLGYDCVDIDWEYPAGNGEDYKRIPNSKKTDEIQSYPKLLKEIKNFIGDKELSIAVPGLERDMIAYTYEQVPKINAVVDFVNIMTYDFMSRRDSVTAHHSSYEGAARAVDNYISRGFAPSKLNLGFAFYAKWFATKKGVECSGPTGCPTELLEAADGSDTGNSGTITFERANFVEAPSNLTTSPDGSCGASTFFRCGEVTCCSQFGFCGNTTAHCSTGCQSAYGRCEEIDIPGSFRTALANGHTDAAAGAQWYWDATNSLYWTWDTADLITQKINGLVPTKGLGGIFAWSLVQDSQDWSRLTAMREGFNALSGQGSGIPNISHFKKHQGQYGRPSY
ncbi:hypothetical protein N0V84_007445 [Fusarium piperis]|uniref:chitinase n=1 Tax=Fusarium piperis TaxID=1435070 RepID=A0A9W8W9X1_9HYPO|nr:hypothetical protein N0V84_007445 [Fusarium piperis]